MNLYFILLVLKQVNVAAVVIILMQKYVFIYNNKICNPYAKICVPDVIKV